MNRYLLNSDARARGAAIRSIIGAALLSILFAPCPIFGAEGRAEPSTPSTAGAPDTPPRKAPEQALKSEGFVSNTLCLDCHPDEATRWRNSHHALAMQPASTDSVLGDFDDRRFTQGRVSTLFSREGENYRIRSEDGKGNVLEGRVAYTFGVHPLQQYLVESTRGRLQALTVAWDVESERWFPLQPEEEIDFENALHWSGRYYNWNAMCADCHSTHFQKNYETDRDRYSSTWAEINVSCQSCHGPGEEHLNWARSEAAGREYDAAGPGQKNGAMGLLFGSDPGMEIERCAPCHSRRHPLGGSHSSDRAFLDRFIPNTLGEGLYHADGQILEEVYVYGSFLQSRMYAAGVRCSDCHDPHDLELVSPGDALCTRCHGENPDRRFPQLPKQPYDTPKHHKHPQKSTGARCVACHMPGRLYMGVDLRHDHALQVPRPDLSHRLGVPNPCTGCHIEKTAEWAAKSVAENYGPKRERGPHWATPFHDGRKGAADGLEDLLALTPPGAAPDIVRATALSLAARYGEGARPALQAATMDSAPLLRLAAATALSHFPPADRLAGLPKLLSDPRRSIRLEAARGLATAPSEILGKEASPLRDLALAEYVSGQQALGDLPSAQLNLAILDTELGEFERARAAYRRALELDPAFLPALANWAQLESALGDPLEATRILRRGLEKLPDEGELHYSLGLLLAAEGQLRAAAAALERAASLLPDRPRVHYNYGLASQNLGESEKAEKAFLRATRLDPMESDFPRALAILFAQAGDWGRALAPAEKLVELAPDSPEFRQLLLRIRAESSGR